MLALHEGEARARLDGKVELALHVRCVVHGAVHHPHRARGVKRQVGNILLELIRPQRDVVAATGRRRLLYQLSQLLPRRH